MSVHYIEVSRNGQQVAVPSVEIDGTTVITSGRLLRVATIKDETFVEPGTPTDAERLVRGVASSGLGADLLAFSQAIDDPKPRYPYYFEMDNVAAAETRDFNAWWDRLPQSTRKNSRRAARRGVETSVVALDDRLVSGIKAIYDETPFRQGRRFWHYAKDLETVRRDNSSYLDRSDFVATYFSDELIGFMKIVYVGRVARIMQILSSTAHFDKRPMNALIAKGVEVCNQKGMSHLVYSKFQYGNKSNTQLEEFKTRNGFERLDFPRYYVPLTLRGRLGVACRLHRGALGILPGKVITGALRLRDAINAVSKQKDGAPNGRNDVTVAAEQ